MLINVDRCSYDVYQYLSMLIDNNRYWSLFNNVDSMVNWCLSLLIRDVFRCLPLLIIVDWCWSLFINVNRYWCDNVSMFIDIWFKTFFKAWPYRIHNYSYFEIIDNFPWLYNFCTSTTTKTLHAFFSLLLFIPRLYLLYHQNIYFYIKYVYICAFNFYYFIFVQDENVRPSLDRIRHILFHPT